MIAAIKNNTIEVYQLKIRLLHISPSIWRRALVRSDSTIADLHHTIQILMGWEDIYLHQFTIHGKKYGISYEGGELFSDNPKQVQLKQFSFHTHERFIYGYNFYDNWEHEIRIESCFVPLKSRKVYPFCISGARAAPPEGCGGSWQLMRLRQKYSKPSVAIRIMEIISENNEDACNDEFENLKYWFGAENFDKDTVNDQLSHYFSTKDNFHPVGG